MEIQNDGTYPHFVPLSVLIIANTCTPSPHTPPSKKGHTRIAGGGTHTWAEQSATTWLSGEVFSKSFCCQPPPPSWRNSLSSDWRHNLQLLSAPHCQNHNDDFFWPFFFSLITSKYWLVVGLTSSLLIRNWVEMAIEGAKHTNKRFKWHMFCSHPTKAGLTN